ncbi:MAG: deoxyribodipyrimidine photolyase, partial [Steroidobacteraceae bacterium]
ALRAEHPKHLADWVADAGATQLVTPYVTRGPLYDWLQEAKPLLDARGILLAEWRREWDAAIWPHATAGFFKVKQRIPDLLGRMRPT